MQKKKKLTKKKNQVCIASSAYRMRDAHSTFAPENFALPSLGLNGTLTSESACGFLREIRKARGITSCDSRDNFDLGNFKFT